MVTFTAETNMPVFDPAAWYGQHLNNSNNVVDFGGARTDGSVWLHREGNVWVLKTWPRERNFTLEFAQTRFAQPSQVQCAGGTASETIPVQTARGGVCRSTARLNTAGQTYREEKEPE